MNSKRQEKIINAYNSLLAKDEISSIHGLKRKIYLTEIQRSKFVSFFFLKISREFNIALRQKLCLVLLNTNFNCKVLISKNYGESKIFCIPSEWLNVLSNYCIVNKVLTGIQFYFFIFLYGIKSIFKSFLWIYELFKYKKDKEIEFKPYLAFIDLVYPNLPIADNENSNTIIDWYFNSYKEQEDVKMISHTLRKEKYCYGGKIIVEEFSLLSAISFIDKIKLICYLVYTILVTLLLFILGRWEYLFMVSDIIKSKFYQEVNSKLLAKEYLFSYSNLDYRPLWTYITESRGSQVTFWAYASSLSGIRKKTGEYTFTDYAWEISTWPTVLVFTKAFKEFIENIVLYKSKVLLFNTPIANTDGILPDNLPNEIKDKTIISIFDVSPVSDINAALLLHDPRYRTVENGKKFISEICETFNHERFFILFKVKRPLKYNSIFDQAYIEYIESLTKVYKNVFLCHGDISAEKIIRLSNLCISIPFTSTAFIASMVNVESVFYDGSGMVQPDDKNLQGIRLISGKDQLLEFKQTKFK